jgi:hypothetical protein
VAPAERDRLASLSLPGQIALAAMNSTPLKVSSAPSQMTSMLASQGNLITLVGGPSVPYFHVMFTLPYRRRRSRSRTRVVEAILFRSAAEALRDRTSPDQTRWIACRPGFFLLVRVLSRRFRKLFPAAGGFAAGELRFSDALAELTEPESFASRLAPLRGTEWVTHPKRPFAGPEQVLAYLGRYTHRQQPV